MKNLAFMLLIFTLLIPPALAKPELKEKYLNQQWGTIGTEFVFRVKYIDESGKEPAYVRIFFSDSSHDMKKISGSPKTGAMYQYSFIAGEEDAFYHVYYFEASDGTETARLFDPTTADQTYGGPLILKSRLDNNKIYLFSRESNKPLWEYPIGKDWALNVEIAEDAKTIVAKTSDYIYAFSKEGKLLWKYLTGLGDLNNNDPAGYATVSTDGEDIFAAGGGKMYHFRRNSNSPTWQYMVDAGIYNIQMSDDNRYVAVGRYDDRLDLVDGNNGRILWHYDADGGFHAVGISGDGNNIIAGTHCPDRAGYLFSKENNRPIWRKYLNDYGSPVWSGTISSDGKYIIFGLDGSDMKQPYIFFLSKDSGTPLWSYELKGWVRSVAISSDGSFAVAGTGDKRVIMFSRESNVPLWEHEAGDKVGAVDITPDGDYIAAGTKAKQVLLFSRESNDPIWSFKAEDWVNWVAFSPDGKYIAASTGAPQYIYEGHGELTKPENQIEGDTSLTGINCGDSICESERGETKEGCPKDCCPPTGCINNNSGNGLKREGMVRIIRNENGREIVEYADAKNGEAAIKEEDTIDEKSLGSSMELPDTGPEPEKRGFFYNIINLVRRLFRR